MRRREQSLRAKPWFTTMLVLLIALVAVAGLCVADAHAAEQSGNPALHLCVGVPGVSLVSAPLVALAVMGRAPISGHAGIAFSALEVLELPPKP